jgi:allophanate hydrolase
VDLSLPLAGVPFAVKDNIDVEGLLHDGGMPSFSYTATRTATVVERLIEAGAILIGQDQHGSCSPLASSAPRTPYGECASVLRPSVISPAVRVRDQQWPSLAGCARFPLAPTRLAPAVCQRPSTTLVGLKPTRGVLSTAGVVPACRFRSTASRCSHRASLTQKSCGVSLQRWTSGIRTPRAF